MTEYITEAEAMDLNSDGGADEHTHSNRLDEIDAAYQRLRRLMRDARQAEVGATIHCAQCEKRIVKRSYQTAFCSNAKTHGWGNCKDRYHNRVKALGSILDREPGEAGQ